MGSTPSGLISPVILALDIWVIVNILKSIAETGMEIIWIPVVTVLPALGLIIWVIAGPRSNVRLQFPAAALAACGVVVSQVDGGAGASESPDLDTGLEAAHIDVLRPPDRGFQRVEVSGGEGVGFARSTQGYVLSGPGTNAGQRVEAPHQRLGAVRRVQARLSRGDRRGEAL